MQGMEGMIGSCLSTTSTNMIATQSMKTALRQRHAADASKSDWRFAYGEGVCATLVCTDRLRPQCIGRAEQSCIVQEYF